MSPFRDNEKNEACRDTRGARRVIREFSKEVRIELGSALIKVQLGLRLGMPLSRPMPGVHPGAHELRFRYTSGIQRVFYYTEMPRAILVFHAFVKKTPTTPHEQMVLGQTRLKEMLE